MDLNFFTCSVENYERFAREHANVASDEINERTVGITSCSKRAIGSDYNTRSVVKKNLRYCKFCDEFDVLPFVPGVISSVALRVTSPTISTSEGLTVS